jgi:hypothetical protein
MRSQLPPTTPVGDIATGCVLTVVFHVIFIVVVFGIVGFFDIPSFLEYVLTAFLLGLGLSQFLYIGPAIYYAYRRGRPNIAKGFIIGAGITFLLMAACWAIINPFNSSNLFR